MPKVDILIPVYSRVPVLKQALEALWQQAIPSGWEVGTIISDDGSPGRLSEVVSATSPPSAWRDVRILRQSHQGIAAARNRALQASQADIIVWLGADIILRPLALAKHLYFHQEHPEANAGAVGYVVWDPLLRPTAFMQWMIHGGPQNNFDGVLGEKTADPRHYFYGSHISLKRSFVSTATFRSGYEPYGWEDLDMGHQLHARGLQLHVLHRAVGLHHHRYPAKAIYRRQQATGATVSLFIDTNKISESQELTSVRRAKVFFYRFTGLRALFFMIISTYGEKHSLPRLYHWATAGEFWYGVIKGQPTKKANKY